VKKCNLTSPGARRLIGVISDTHGLLRPEATRALAGVDLIVHAGDIGNPEILGELRKIAPVAVIKGNNDNGHWARRLPDVRAVKVGQHKLYVIHDVHDLDFDPAKRNFGAVISGHSHKPSVSEKDGVLFLNPGSSGPRRFKLPVAVGKIFIQGAHLRAKIIELALR
jgi:hypothetical protein